ncbi:UDP-N-acetylmuramoyl-tripeptide--D-alanyl-D-alanine ligase [Desertibacillus haloalkaliphilus]|uniref:UDP-N-acetylmuramoyl-tripeptide--D-alanyl-D- alanine ligase n=1 Tax=Desertibacillus haloalkaliphilus TaxID=1328930 RepID=UPI001C280B3D|nr:UDP-N-acetylmuramoyl-tripeptide--D-alanyl-D-alanine ligase [Desertibacillus haloalkaliphilus]MBU8907114.1 UDP-N-acetylmuramoyl-tripeptide--D-alanyl-D-alanine ligase [Desertibacillus haloalkaliphilus]
MKVTSSLIKQICLKTKHIDDHDGTGYDQVTIDSRVSLENGLFVPIVGERFDGHDFLEDAIKNGASATLWQEGHPLPDDLPSHVHIYFVKDTLQALQQLAELYVQDIKPIVVGVTGSNGKTTTKDIIESVVSKSYQTHKTEGNFNNHIGLPLTILDMPRETELLILEMGMSGFGEISFLSKLAKPNYAVVTNIGESHIEQLGSREGIAKAKMEIVDGLNSGGKVIVDGDEPLLTPYLTPKTVCCGYGERNDVRITSVNGNEKGYVFKLANETSSFMVPLLGKHNVKNTTFAIALARDLAIDDQTIQAGLEELAITTMRLQTLKGKRNALIVNDAYNASPTSMIAAVETIKSLNNYMNKVVVLGDMYELGNDEEDLHRSVAASISDPITAVITIGDRGQWIADELRKENSHTMDINSYQTKEEAIPMIESLLDENTVILFKASRGLQLETIIEKVTS